MPIVYKAGLSDSEVNAVESALNVTLPDSYRQLLKRMNGFYLTEPDYGQLPLPAIDEGVISFDRLFGVVPDEECNDLVGFNSGFIDELSFIKGVFAIGEDGGGNPYVLISEPGREGVYYWDRTHLHEGGSVNKYDIAEQDECGHLYLVAKDIEGLFDTLVSSLGGDVAMVEEA
ncbi:SMI1/KNR4 family protein [Pseudomonas tussilaginis]|uniref:SMI1/KNR4 family protein n=1 Tax=unclassified Pseudomonas TaxID=196821 RepID=UPI000C6DF027|nr:MULTISPECIES: SMI1/KNR4 family protein [unclassified Pseudomonas]QYX48274.1 SMI1/KNR4 family protein [Pseudomonas sp. S11A 273]